MRSIGASAVAKWQLGSTCAVAAGRVERVADDEVLLRKALASLLPLEGDITVLAEAVDGAEAVRATLTHRPDVLVTVEEIERRHILMVLQSVKGHRTQASQILGLDRKTLYRKLERYGQHITGASTQP